MSDAYTNEFRNLFDKPVRMPANYYNFNQDHDFNPLGKRTTKNTARGAKINWDAVEKATEIARSYEIQTIGGGIIFHMYKPSEVKDMLQKGIDKARGWKSITLVGVKGERR